MLNAKSSHIFDHEGFTYVLDFDKMTCWIVTEEDDSNPVTTLHIRRRTRGAWSYRPADCEGDFTPDSDQELMDKIEKRYEQYLSEIIVDKNERSKADNVTPIRSRRVRQANLSD